MIFILYIIFAVIVVLFSLKCAKYVDLIDKKTNISGAFIGGIVLAAITSLPELITSISSVTIVDSPGLVLGNVLGSNIFNLSVIGVGLIFATKSYLKSMVAKSHIKTIIVTILIYLMIFASAFITNISILSFSLYSVIIIILYFISLKALSQNESSDDNTEEDIKEINLTVPQIVKRFIIMSIGLVISSVFITYITDIIAEKLNMGTTLAGALLLGIATSLPELSSSIALIRIGNFNATFGNIIGSNAFNFLILSIIDIIYIKGSIYIISSQVKLLTIFGLAASLILGLILFLKKKKFSSIIFIRILSFLIILCYILFLFLSVGLS